MDDGQTVQERRCEVEECGNKHWGKGYCSKHYARWKKWGNPSVLKKRWRGRGECSVSSCGKPCEGYGYCSAHYYRWKKHGDPLKSGREDRRKQSYVNGDNGYLLLQTGRWAIVDAAEFAHLNQWQWREQNGYVLRDKNKADGGKNGIVLLHRLVASTPKHLVTDHRRHETLDNRKAALRNGSRMQNTRNRIKRGIRMGTPTTSKYKGVGLVRPRKPWHKLTKRWYASIRVRGRLTYIGYFETEREAAVAYNKAATAEHGEWACLNVID